MAERKNSEARIKSNNKWTNAHYDRINLAVPKGRKAEIQVLAEAGGQSVNGFIVAAIDEKLKRDGVGGPQRAAELAVVGDSSIPPAAAKAVQATTGAARVAQIAGVSLPSEMMETVKVVVGATGEAVDEFLVRAVRAQVQQDRSSLKMGINPVTGDKIKRGKGRG